MAGVHKFETPVSIAWSGLPTKLKKWILLVLALTIYLNIGWEFRKCSNVGHPSAPTAYEEFFIGGPAGAGIKISIENQENVHQVSLVVLWPLYILFLIAGLLINFLVWIGHELFLFIRYLIWLIFAGGIAKTLFG